ncbi:hypothetical protein R3P38DRAFT_3070436 [Favolaschia claudopus]|uniref:Uncharacterized protein n=1 Tax=Favolaschia claudopus TaxID=2862362 RepID=A0AAW0A0B5_9AGAR
MPASLSYSEVFDPTITASSAAVDAVSQLSAAQFQDMYGEAEWFTKHALALAMVEAVGVFPVDNHQRWREVTFDHKVHMERLATQLSLHTTHPVPRSRLPLYLVFALGDFGNNGSLAREWLRAVIAPAIARQKELNDIRITTPQPPGRSKSTAAPKILNALASKSPLHSVSHIDDPFSLPPGPSACIMPFTRLDRGLSDVLPLLVDRPLVVRTACLFRAALHSPLETPSTPSAIAPEETCVAESSFSSSRKRSRTASD